MAQKDVNDILGQDKAPPTPGDENVKLKSSKVTKKAARRPTGMSREVYNLFAHGPNEVDLQTVVPSEKNNVNRFKNAKTNRSFRRTRKWVWKPFTNEAREDGFQLMHWEREDRKPKDPYIFARMNKKLSLPIFTEDEYNRLIAAPNDKWSFESTVHLFDLCQRFDLRWPIIVDRFEKPKFGSDFVMEDLKDQYYKVSNALKKEREPNEAPFFFDTEHEKKRKEQLERLWTRTEDDIKEEETLRQQMKHFENKRKEREKRAQDLQRLINVVERTSVSPEANGAPSSSAQATRDRRKNQKNRNPQTFAAHLFTDQINKLRFTEFHSAGPHLRSHEMKLPSNIGQKKLKSIEVAIEKYKFPIAPYAYEEIVKVYNEFRSKVVFAQELRNALQGAQQDLEGMQARMRSNNGSVPR